LGDTRAYAQRMNLAKAVPSMELASTRYCLAEPGRAYLVYLPEGGLVTVDLSAAAGPFAVEWFDPERRTAQMGEAVMGGGKAELRAPFAGDAVLLLSRD
jgi:Putative collagen-binding domain of a collagenase